MGKSSFLFFCFLLPALLLVMPLELSAQNSDGQEKANVSGLTLNRLIEISGQLSTLNGKLASELQDSRRNSRELLNMLEASKPELEGLKRELEALRNSSTELLTRAESSETELTALQEALRTAGSSLMSLELSFASYREEANRQISVLKRKNNIWKWTCIALGIAGAGLGTAFLATR